ncbi:NAD-dependent epimerase/dehydratase family protein [Candidatus Thioglobus sp.]|nr:NAD-dependent epimerase/dehydratase family protein [Candidatus Thioglobus sp.]
MEEVVVKTVLITGGLGCLGGRLSQYLTNSGYQVVIGSSRRDAKLPNELVSCSLAYTDFDDIDALATICHEVDYVVHLATINAQQSQEKPELAVKVNGIGAYNLIQASIKSKVKYFLYLSTAHVYGSPLTGEVDENTLPRPLHPYAITHRLAEDFLLESIGNKNIKGSVVRLSNSIGLPLIKETNCWMLFVNDACKQAVIDQRIVIHSNPDSERDFIPMNTVCEIAEYFLSIHPTADYPIFNVGSGFSHTLLQIAEMIADRCEELFGFCPKIVFSENNSSQNLKLSYKVNKLTMEMGYVTNNNLNPSIDEVLRFCNAEFN